MSQVLNEQILGYLWSLTESDLRKIGQKYGLEFTPYCGRGEIIDEIRRKCGLALSEKLKSANLLDVELVECGLARAIEREVANGLKGVEWLKWIMTTVGAALSLVVAGGAALTGWKVYELDDELKIKGKEMEELKLQAEKLVEQEKIVSRAHTSAVFRRIIRYVEDLMESFSLTLRDPKIALNLREYEEILDELDRVVDVSRGGKYQDSHAKTDEQKMGKLLGGLIGAILTYDAIKAGGGEDQEKLVSEAAAQWRKLDVDVTFENPSYADFTKKMKAYKYNVEGALLLLQSQYAKVNRGEMLDEARVFFDKAVKESKESNGIPYARPLSNIAHVISEKIKLQLANKDRSVTENQFDEALKFLQMASQCEFDPARIVLIRNNQSSTLLDKCEYLLADGKREAAEKCYDEAKELSDAVVGVAEGHPVVYVTRAEVIAYGVRVHIAMNKLVEGEQRIEEILKLVNQARAKRYVGYTKLTKESFFDSEGCFAKLRHDAPKLGKRLEAGIDALLSEKGKSGAL